MRYLSPNKTRMLTLVGILLGVTVYQFANSAGPTNGFDSVSYTHLRAHETRR